MIKKFCDACGNEITEIDATMTIRSKLGIPTDKSVDITLEHLHEACRALLMKIVREKITLIQDQSMTEVKTPRDFPGLPVANR